MMRTIPAAQERAGPDLLGELPRGRVRVYIHHGRNNGWMKSKVVLVEAIGVVVVGIRWASKKWEPLVG